MPVALVAVTAAGRAAAARLAEAWPGQTRTYSHPARASLPRAFAECSAVVAFLATGATVRLLAPHLDGKHTDPGVVCVDEGWGFAVALLGGHEGGANDLAHRVAAVLGSEPVVTTGSEAAAITGVDELADTMGWRIEPGSDRSGVAAAMLSGEAVSLVTDRTWPLPALPASVAPATEPAADRPAVVVTDGASDLVSRPGTVVYRPPTLAVGVGASRGVSRAEVLDLIENTLHEAGASARSVRYLATADVKADEPGLAEAAAALGVPLVTYPAETLARVEVLHPSEAVRTEVGTPSVAEAAALCSAEPTPPAELVTGKRKSAHATLALARHPPRGRLALVGIGPGSRDLLTPRAVSELRRAAVVVGLDQYVQQVRDLLRPGTRVLASGLGDERERAAAAAEEARRGHAVALLGSGDAGVYALASPVLEGTGRDVDVVGVPGVTAALAASSLLGAPLGHDHAVISLSDLHTPWEIIERRLRAAAEGDLVVAFYNPRSSARDWQLPRALRILAGRRPPGTPVGLVRAAGRTGQDTALATLADVDPDRADMSTLVIVGSSTTRVVGGRMVTPRGYRWSATNGPAAGSAAASAPPAAGTPTPPT